MARLFVRNLTVLDFAYLDGERGLLGESWRVHVELGGDLDAQGMVLDFALVKRGIKRTLDAHFDHCLLVPGRHPGLELTNGPDGQELVFPLADGSRIVHASPPRAVTLIDAAAVTPETVREAALATLRPTLPDNVRSLGLELEPEAIEGAYFHYAHGLKHHDGNCQRIAHGHRSRIEIRRDGRRDPALEQAWAERWRDVYIATREDLVEADGENMRFSYTSGQGRFSLSLPRERCYLVETDSTIENLAQHVAQTTAREQPRSRIEARVFEGIDKGGLGEAPQS